VKTKKKISQSRKGAKGIGSLFASLRLCARKIFILPPHRTFKKNNSSAAADAKKITLAKPSYRRQDAMAPRIFLCVSASWCENKEKNLAKQESR
jgi:hypothetical protein